MHACHPAHAVRVGTRAGNNAIQEGSNTFGTDNWNEGCMWDSDQFKGYLVEQGHPTAWDDTIYPGMKEVRNFAIITWPFLADFSALYSTTVRAVRCTPHRVAYACMGAG